MNTASNRSSEVNPRKLQLSLPTAKRRSNILAAGIVFTLLQAVCVHGTFGQEELNAALMNSTFEVLGPSATTPGQTTFGTVFFLGKPLENVPGKAYFVLITAAHVFDEIAGDDATLILRKKDGGNAALVSLPYPIKIRSQGVNLYTKNPDADVAAMYLAIPSDAEVHLLSIDGLVDDSTLERLNVHPGDELSCLGFPLNISLNGFPVLRSGTLASYPITPSKTTKTYYYAFHVFPGNSGGPVYYSFLNRIYGGSAHLADVQQGVIGLVSQMAKSTTPGFENAEIDIGLVVPSSYIKDTLKLLPPKP